MNTPTNFNTTIINGKNKRLRQLQQKKKIMHELLTPLNKKGKPVQGKINELANE